ncbi:MAG: TetR/AcrR family transcriptional regulator [Pseudomonadota bacterium]
MTQKLKYTDALADFVLAHGIGAASLRPMAKAAGTSDRMLVYHYGSKAGVLEAALNEIAQRNMQALEAALPPKPLPAERLMSVLGMVAQSGQFDPVYAVFFELSALALRGDESAKAIGHSVATHFLNWTALRLTEPERAPELLAAVEGWGMLNGLGLDVPFPNG